MEDYTIYESATNLVAYDIDEITEDIENTKKELIIEIDANIREILIKKISHLENEIELQKSIQNSNDYLHYPKS